MRNIRLILEYDGTRYLGWQRQKPAGRRQPASRQPNAERTIQGKLEAVLSRMAGEPVNVIGAARTDAGVHALGQVANFHTASGMSLQEIEGYLRRYLPEDIVAHSLEEADPRFHARYLARRKRYRYCIVNRRVPDVFRRRYALHVPEPLDLAAMERAAALLLGERDFSGFASHLSAGKSPVRRLEAVRILGREGSVEIEYVADGFLRGMARILTGTLLEVGAGRRDPGEMAAVLAARRRALAGPLAPAHGLFLVEAIYR